LFAIFNYPYIRHKGEKTLDKQSVLVLGAGKIGSLITCLLSNSMKYNLHVVSLETDEVREQVDELSLPNVTITELDVMDTVKLKSYMQKYNFNAVISGLPYYCNIKVADLCAELGLNYFDLTEDVEVTRHVKKISQGKKNVFMPQCGLAPGFISIAAHDLMKDFEEIDIVKMRVGALPVNPNNVLKYSLTWSTDGLINEYGNTCFGIHNKEMVPLQPLEGYETITLDGVLYEAFNTSGGLGTLADSYENRVNTMNYKTIRYPGHCKEMILLMNDLKLNHDRDTLKRILENAIPKTLQDVVLIYVAVSGKKHGHLFEENYLNKVYPQKIAGKLWSSIQVTTAAGICGVMDIVLNNIDKYQGFVTQESISLDDFLENQFGQYYISE